MMNQVNQINHNEYLTDKNFDLLKLIAEWKAISIKSLQKMSGHEGSREGFFAQVRRLEKRGLIKSFYKTGLRLKFVHITNQALNEFFPDHFSRSMIIKEDQLYHDAVASNVVQKLNEFPTLNKSFLRHQFFNQQSFSHYLPLDPDALFFGTKANRPFTMSLEIELTQKSRTRIFEKFSSYANSEYFKIVVYLFDKFNIYDAYQRFHSELCASSSPKEAERFKNKILFCFDSNLHRDDLNVAESICTYLGTELKLKEVLDE
jgi:hypothetical protein